MNLRYKKLVSGFTMVEILVAMVVLSIGLLGMAGMTMMVFRGNRGASDLTSATNICQMKVEELKDVDWQALGSATQGSADAALNGVLNGIMFQEGAVGGSAGLNGQGNTRQDQFEFVEKVDASSPCNGQTWGSQSSQCNDRLDALGPYRYARTFVICKGEDYTNSAGTPMPPTSPVNTTYEAAPVAGVMKGETEPDCRVDPSVSTTRSKWLACKSEDISTVAGPGNREKKIKVLCAWRTSDGTCRSVHLDTTKVNFQ